MVAEVGLAAGRLKLDGWLWGVWRVLSGGGPVFGRDRFAGLRVETAVLMVSDLTHPKMSLGANGLFSRHTDDGAGERAAKLVGRFGLGRVSNREIVVAACGLEGSSAWMFRRDGFQIQEGPPTGVLPAGRALMAVGVCRWMSRCWIVRRRQRCWVCGCRGCVMRRGLGRCRVCGWVGMCGLAGVRLKRGLWSGNSRRLRCL